jgi:hypothetical protein
MRARGVKGAASAAELPKNRFAIAKRHNHGSVCDHEKLYSRKPRHNATPLAWKPALRNAGHIHGRHLGLWPEKIVLRPNGNLRGGAP